MRTSTPWRTKRAAHPPPMTPPPSRPTWAGLPNRLLQPELRPNLIRAEDAHVHRLENRDRSRDQVRVGGETPAGQVEVVLEADAHIAAREHRHRGVCKLHAADREGREDRVRGQAS